MVYQFILRLYQFNTNGNIDPHAVIHDPMVGSPDDVVRINNAIYQHAHQQWFDYLAKPQPSLADLADELQHDMHAVVNKIATDTVFIDPRFCYTWPVWSPLFTDTSDQVFFVVPYHSPHEITAVLNHEDGIPHTLGYLLWSAYMLAAERHTRNATRFVINHADVVHDWETACGPLIAHINQSAPSDAHVVIQEFMTTYSQIGHAPSYKSPEPSTPAALFADRVYQALTHHADATTLDQLQDEFTHTIIVGIDASQYHQFLTAQTARMRASEAYIHLLQTHHQREVQALHDDYKAQLDEVYTHLNENAAAIHQKLTLRIHELHDFYAEKLKEIDSPEHQRTQQLTTKIEHMNTMLQQRTQHIQDLKFALDKQKSAYNAHIDTISHDITTEREYYQQTIDNLTKQIAWQQQTLNEQRNQLHLARFVMPLILLAHRIRKTFQRA
jgi:hypothetical protein